VGDDAASELPLTVEGDVTETEGGLAAALGRLGPREERVF
jgi:hypothetical protein